MADIIAAHRDHNHITIPADDIFPQLAKQTLRSAARKTSRVH